MGEPLSRGAISRLAVLVFLHDAGKLHPGFQAKGWPSGLWRESFHGHVREGAAIFLIQAPEVIARNLHLAALIDWGIDKDLLFAVLAHHGRPFKPEDAAGKRWDAVPAFYDPAAASADIGDMMRQWFPEAFAEAGTKVPSAAGFQHLFCGLVALADWLGSDRRIFEFVGSLDASYMDKARKKAAKAVADIGLDVSSLRPLIAGRAEFAAITGFGRARSQQQLVGDFPLAEHLVIFEAETGSGKTEAALWRFARLFEAGLVDSLYFALPTRAAAVQLHGRVNTAMKRLFGEAAREAVLAVPGYMQAGEVKGERLPEWRVHWDDQQDADEPRLLARWAAENAKRYLAAAVAVGTVDQAMLATLQVKHAHLRAAALSRSLLIIDEVHASDRYMTEVQTHLLKMHLTHGGHAMLMSATLGSAARDKWLGRRPTPSFDEAVAAPYPAVWGKSVAEPASAAAQEMPKRVAMTFIPTMAPDEAARLAIEAARAQARVLVVRNTVAAAIETWEAVQAEGAGDLLLAVAGGPALHHGRFAPEDRKLLDGAVESALSPKERIRRGVIVVGSQTLEQSLDIDADLLLTDLCPADVLLQRIGRLHRHKLARPPGFEAPRCHVMVPERGLARLLAPSFENGLGGWVENGVLNGIYRDLSALELTRRLIVRHPVWTIPAMNRLLVEGATHPGRIEALHEELGADWARYWIDVYGKDVADVGAARRVVLPVETPFADVLFPSDEERIRTRLGAEGAAVAFATPVDGPFDVKISGVTLPAHWSRGIDASEKVTPELAGGVLTFRIADTEFHYDRRGLTRKTS